MQAKATTSDRTLTRAIVKGVLLPAEHGSWSFILEPVVLGLLMAPVLGGALVAIASLCAFMAHRPLRVAIDAWRAGQTGVRALWGRRFALGFTLAAVVVAALATALGDARFWWVLPAAVPLVAVQLVLALSKRQRTASAEGTGALALAGVAAAIVLAGAGTSAVAAAAWLLIACRSVPAIAYVRARLRQDRGKPHNAALPLALHGLGVLVAAALTLIGAAPWNSMVVFAVLLLRAALGLAPSHRPVPARIVGVQETLWGGLTVLLIASGYRLGAWL